MCGFREPPDSVSRAGRGPVSLKISGGAGPLRVAWSYMLISWDSDYEPERGSWHWRLRCWLQDRLFDLASWVCDNEQRITLSREVEGDMIEYYEVRDRRMSSR